jgi:hypothetical protein
MCIAIIQDLIKYIWDVPGWRLIPVSMQTVKQRARKVFFPQKCTRPLLYVSYPGICITDRSIVLCEETWALWSSCVASINTTDESLWSVLRDCKVQQFAVCHFYSRSCVIAVWFLVQNIESFKKELKWLRNLTILHKAFGEDQVFCWPCYLSVRLSDEK